MLIAEYKKQKKLMEMKATNKTLQSPLEYYEVREVFDQLHSKHYQGYLLFSEKQKKEKQTKFFF